MKNLYAVLWILMRILLAVVIIVAAFWVGLDIVYRAFRAAH